MKETILQQNEGPPAVVQKLTARAQRHFNVQKRPGLLTCLIILSTMIGQSHAQQKVQLEAAQTESSYGMVSEISVIKIDLTRKPLGVQWQTNQCYQMQFIKPYTKDNLYKSFDSAKPPTCTALLANTSPFTMSCSLRAGTTDTVIFRFLQFTASTSTSEGAQSSYLSFEISNFRNPYSSVSIGVNINYYSDANCIKDQSQLSASSLQFSASELLPETISLTSTNSQVAYQGPENTLIAAFTTATTLPPSGQGYVNIRMPNWYRTNSGNKKGSMYTDQPNRCTADHLTISGSQFATNILTVTYSAVEAGFFVGKTIKISCKGFKNPITPTIWGGFGIDLYDNEDNYISSSYKDVTFDATNFSPVILPSSNFKASMGDSTVGSYSTWQLSMDINTPLVNGCYIQVLLPSDLKYDFQSLTVTKIFITPNGQTSLNPSDFKTIAPSPGEKRQSVLFTGCNDANSLGEAPSGTLRYNQIAMPRMVKTSEPFNINIYKDASMKQLIVTMVDGVTVPADKITAGVLQNLSMGAKETKVQTVTTIIVSFQTSHALDTGSMVEIKMPGNFTLPANGKELTVSRVTPTGQIPLKAIVTGGGSYIQIFNVLDDLESIPDIYLCVFNIPGIKLQNSAQDAGGWSVTTKARFTDGSYYDVDTLSMATSFTATPGVITADSDMEITNPVTWGKNSMYTMKFTAQDDIPAGGYIKMVPPPQVQLDVSATKTMGTCQTQKCTDDTNSQQIVILVQQGIPKGTSTTLKIGGMQNPRSYQPTDDFVITTMDTDGKSIIDVGYNKQAVMSQMAELDQFHVRQSNFVNGVKNRYDFSLQSQIPFITGDTIYFVFPPELSPPSTEQVNQETCLPRNNLVKVSCQISSGKFILTVLEPVPNTSTATYGWTIENVGNPISTQTTGPFENLNLRSKEGYRVGKYTGQDTTITNKFPAPIVNYNLQQQDLTQGIATTYIAEFFPVNAIPKLGTIQLTYPDQLILLDGEKTQCLVTTYMQFNSNCQIDPVNKIIIISDVFSLDDKSYSGQISIQLKNVQNPPNNKNIGTFTIKTYADQARVYVIDETDKLKPIIQCDFPCKTCSKTDRGVCNSCWQDLPTDQQYLQNNQCKSSCDLGYSSNSLTNSNKVCQPCDQSCNLCFDTDTRECINCQLDSFPFRLTQTNRCFAQCGQGLFQSTNTTCSQCKAPCGGCFGTESNCTSCDSSSTKPHLYNNQCIESCPSGFTSVVGVCQECISPCSECKGLPNYCTSCDGTNKLKLSFNGLCNEICPPGSTPNSTASTCTACPGSGCSLCDLSKLENCLLCDQNLFILNATCVSECPDGMVVNDDKTACRPSQLQDLGILYFPFLIAGLIFILVVVFGNMRKKPQLVKGRAELVSNQKSVTCILVGLSPLQTMAVWAQWILAILYGIPVHAGLAIAVCAIILITSIVFQITYGLKFKHKELPADRKKQLDAGKITKVQAATYEVQKDQKFGDWSAKHNKMWGFISAFTILSNWKFNKLYYSHFYNYAMFQATWTHTKDYRNMVNWYGIVHMITVDLFLICIAITGLITIEWGNQLFITMIETLVLSLINIGLSSYELYKLPEYLKYTEQEKKQNFAVSTGYDGDLDRDAREKMMKGLINKVKGNKDIFLNNKLDELLNQFGDRRCKSMIELGTGWDKEEDPRKVKTWPISPGTYAEYDYDIKFGPEDAYGMPDNVYADGVTKPKGKEKAMQGDAAQMEFQDALNRKHGDMMSKIDDDVQEQRRLKGNKRRGRKNKYHTQIDNEDDEEAEAVEASDEEHRKNDLQIIKEQEEEEENLRKQVAAEKKKQGEQAADKKAQIEREERTKLELEKAEEEARKQKALLQEAERKNKEEQQARMRLEEELARMKLQQEVALEEARRAAKEKEELLMKAKMSDEARKEYEAKEAERQKKEAQQLAEEKALAEAREKELAAQLAEEKRRREEQAKMSQQEKDAQAIKDKQDALKKLEADREAAKNNEALKKKEEADKKKAQEAATKEEKKKSEEEAAAKKLADKEAAKAKEEEEKRKKQAEKEAKAKADAEEKAKKKPSQPEPVPKKVGVATKEESVIQVNDVKQNEDLLASPRSASVVSKKSGQQAKVSPRADSKSGSQTDKAKDKAKADGLKVEPKVEPKKEEPKKAEPKKEEPKVKETKKVESPKVVVAEKSAIEAKKPAKEIVLSSSVNEEGPPAPQMNKIDEGEEPNSEKEEGANTIVETTDDLLKNFRQDDKPIQIPPDANLRLFNENDILGDLDRDEKGNVIVLQDNKGNTKDRQGKPTNKRGYLVDPKTGALIENLTNKDMFLDKDLDERGEVPAPFCVEKFNFNPHNLMGDFDYVDGQPRMMVTNKGFFVDKKGRRVNKFGWMVLTNQGHLMDRLGRKKLDKKQLTPEGDIPKLFTLSGKRYDIKDVMGQFDKDQLGRIVPHTSKNGKELLDNMGRRVNDKGYLIDPNGNIIDVNNKQLFTFASLKSGEFIKIFPFTKFNIKKVQGDYEMNPNGNPILVKHKDGTLRDKKFRLVNKRGYLIDPSGNVIDDRGKPMFDLCVLEEDGEIPAVFRTGLLKSDTASSLSRLMSEIEKHPSEFDRQEENKINKDPAYEMLRHGDGDTSVDSKMDDTPANYNQANQRFDQDYDDVDAIPEDDENAEHMAPSEYDDKGDQILPKKKPKKKKKKKPTTTTIEFLQPTNREISMAGAYGGAAKGQLRRQGIKYDKERLQGSKKFRVSTADEPKVRAQLQQLANSVSGFNATGEKALPPKVKHQGLMGTTNGFDSNDGKSERQNNSRLKGADSQAKVHPEKKKGLKDGDFEQMFGKDIDQFLEDSEWDIESQFDDKVSHYSKASSQRQNDQKLKAIEKLYLQRLEAQPGQLPQKDGQSKKKKGGQGPQGRHPDEGGYSNKRPKYPKIKPERETIISFTDDPGVIHRGEILPFATKQKKDEVPARGASSMGVGGIPLQKDKSSKGSPDRF